MNSNLSGIRAFGKLFFFLLIIVILIRFFCLFLALNDIPPTNIGQLQEKWWAGQGGDSYSYFKSAKSLLANDFLPGAHPIGFSLLLAPFIVLFQADSIDEIAKAVNIFQGVFLYSLAVILIYFLAKSVLVKKYKALIISALFLIYPYLFYYFFHFFAKDNALIARFTVRRFKQLMFLGVFSDALSMVLMLASLLLLLKILKDKRDKILSALLLGIISSWAVVTRLPNAVIIPFYSLILWIFVRFKKAFYFLLGAAPLILWQLYINWRANDSVSKATYGLEKVDIDTQEIIPMISWQYPLRLITYPLEYSPLLLLVMLFCLLIIGIGIYRAIKGSKTVGGIVLTGYLFFNVFFISFLEPTFRNPRYFLPAIPIIFIFAFLGVEQLFLSLNSYARKKN